MKSIDNPSLPIRNRKTTTMDFDEKINLNVNGRVGDKVNMNINYNTDATFDFDSQNMKLKYDGKEDEIVKLIEAGNVSFPPIRRSSKGASSLSDYAPTSSSASSSFRWWRHRRNPPPKSVSSKGRKAVHSVLRLTPPTTRKTATSSLTILQKQVRCSHEDTAKSHYRYKNQPCGGLGYKQVGNDIKHATS